MLRVMDLPQWPPDSGGEFKHGDKFAISSEHVVIKEVTKVDGTKLTFTCTFNGKKLSYDYAAPSVRTAEKLAEILQNNVGKTLFSVGVIELPHRKE
jgi:FKBP-type peptidyl-prolyl cis-trans isomerase 2